MLTLFATKHVGEINRNISFKRESTKCPAKNQMN